MVLPKQRASVVRQVSSLPPFTIEQIAVSACVNRTRRESSFGDGTNCREVGFACEVCAGGQWCCDGYCHGTQSCYGC